MAKITFIDREDGPPTKILNCDCGHKTDLSEERDDFTCGGYGCRREYNCFGQALAPREQWGDETGESLTDILTGAPEEMY